MNIEGAHLLLDRSLKSTKKLQKHDDMSRKGKSCAKNLPYTEFYFGLLIFKRVRCVRRVSILYCSFVLAVGPPPLPLYYIYMSIWQHGLLPPYKRPQG
jgi:hypothetical protein